jgi:hypothetical protein
MVEQRIRVEDAQFEQLIVQLKTEHDTKLEHLRAQLRVVNRLLEILTWQHNARFAAAGDFKALSNFARFILRPQWLRDGGVAPPHERRPGGVSSAHRQA